MKKRVLFKVSYIFEGKPQKRTIYKCGSGDWLLEQFINLCDYYVELDRKFDLKDLKITSELIVNTEPFDFKFGSYAAIGK